MIRRLTFIFSLALICGVALVARAAPVAARTPQDEQMKQAILVLRGYIDRAGSYAFWVFPEREDVAPGKLRPGGPWPKDPWTGGPITAGAGPGHYSYWVSGDNRTYRLAGYLSSGRYVLKGGMPGDIMLAYNHRTREGAALLQQYIELWARTHDGVFPAPEEVDRYRGVGTQLGMAYWPSNPWNHEPMRQGARRGRFEYVPAPDGSGYTLTMHLQFGKTMALTEKPSPPPGSEATPPPSTGPATVGGLPVGFLDHLRDSFPDLDR